MRTRSAGLLLTLLLAGGACTAERSSLPRRDPAMGGGFVTPPAAEIERGVAELEKAGLWTEAPPRAAAVPLTSDTVADLADLAAPGVVHVFTRLTLIGSLYEDPLGVVPFKIWLPVPHRGTSLGSGFHLGRGLVVTARSVVGTGERIAVLFPGREEALDAKLLGDLPDLGLALLLLEGDDGATLPTLPLGRDADLRVGELVVALGNPAGSGHRVASGVVAFDDAHIQLDPDRALEGGRFLQTTAVPADAGGPLIDVRGAVVGMNLGLEANDRPGSSFGYAVPVDEIKRAVALLLSQAPLELPVPIRVPAVVPLPSTKN